MSFHPRGIVDLVLPDACRQCRSASDSAGYCRQCAAALARHPHQCHACGVPIAAGEVCGRCQRRAPPFVETVAPFRYTEPLSNDIHKLKYRRGLAYGRDLGILLAAELEHRALQWPVALIPVPLHWRRQWRRGFNQSLEIALPISRALGIPIQPGLVRRRLPTAQQVGLGIAQRRRNLRGAFQATGHPMPASAAIVDDVITSGSTALELAHCLRRAGVERVSVWAIARV